MATFVERLLGASAGSVVTIQPDIIIVNDGVSSAAVDEVSAVTAPEKVWVFYDHDVPTGTPEASATFRKINEFANRFGVRFVQARGIGYQYLLNETVRACQIIVGGGSHASIFGASGALGVNVSIPELARAIETGRYSTVVPEAIKIVLNGHLPDGVLSKDVILKVLGDIKADGGQYKSLEFTGPAAHDMSMMARFTVANMALEAGAKCGLFEADQKTADYYGMRLEDIDWVCVDESAHYETVLTYDVNELEPQLSCPQGVDNVHGVGEIAGTHLDCVYLGSCTNGNLEDLAIAAKIMEGKHVPNDLRFIVVPATNRVFKDAIRAGYIKIFIEAGAVICHPCCGLCCGMPYGLMTDDENILSTANRNFIGRMGTKKTRIYLSSPAVAAASALAGKITDPRGL